MHEITLEGSPYQRGLKHGQTFAKEIKSTYEAICEDLKIEWSEAKAKLLHRLFRNVEESFGDLAEEINGISEGSGTPLDDILLLNFYHGLGAVDFQCTNLGFTNKDKVAIHGKTGDAEDYHSPFYLVETVHPDEGASFVNVCFVGTVWTEAGVNSIGLSCGQSSCSTITGQDGRGIPVLVMPRPLLQHCSSVEEGIEFLAKYPMAGKGLNFFLADSAGNVAVVEKSYTKQVARRAENGVVWNTNHYLDKELAQYNLPKTDEGMRSTFGRYAYLEKVLKEQRVPHTVEEMKKILTNHAEPGVGAICRHTDRGDTSRTHFAAIFIPKERTALITHGNPCENEFKEYKL